jgi:hypothetical protein
MHNTGAKSGQEAITVNHGERMLAAAMLDADAVADRAIARLRELQPRFGQLQFPLVEVLFLDGDRELDIIPEAHINDISWSERGRRYEKLCTYQSAEEAELELTEADANGMHTR